MLRSASTWGTMALMAPLMMSTMEDAVPPGIWGFANM